jgi:hypothetical protein
MKNLRVLQSPLKPFKGVVKSGKVSPSPPKDEPVEDEEIILVQGSNPRVVEEERDLVILEDVEVAKQNTSPSRPVFPHTPIRQGRPSLHKLVLLRSAQRVAMQAENDREEELEELEVAGCIVEGKDEDSDEDLDEMSFSPTMTKEEKSRDQVLTYRNQPLYLMLLTDIVYPTGRLPTI